MIAKQVASSHTKVKFPLCLVWRPSLLDTADVMSPQRASVCRRLQLSAFFSLV